MSIPVAIDDLGTALADYPWGYVLSVDDANRPRARAVPTRFVDGLLLAQVGPGTLRNVAARPGVTMVFPPAQPGAFTLIVDGDAEPRDEGIALRPTAAVLHRPAVRED